VYAIYYPANINNLQIRRQERLHKAENIWCELNFQYLHGKEDMSPVSFIVERQMKMPFIIGLISILKDHH